MLRGRQLGVLASLLVVGVAIPLLVTLAGTPLDVPRNDAFAYSLIAERLHDTGSFQLIRYGRMELIGHVLWGQPFLALLDDREVAGNVAGVIASGIAVAAYFLLALRFVQLRVAAMVTLVFLIFQGVAVNFPTYMTEPTALALDALALLAAVVALERHGRSAALLVMGAVMLCIASFSVREFAIALLVAITGVVALRRRDLRRLSLAAGSAGIVACGALYVWHSQLPGLEPTELGFHFGGVGHTAPGFVTLGLGLLPLTIVASLRLLLSAGHPRLIIVMGAGLGALIALFSLVRPNVNPALGRSALADDVYARSGASGQALAVGVRPDLLPTPAWLILNLLAVVGSIALGAVVAAYLSQRLSRPGRKSPADAGVLLLEVVALAYLGLVAVFGILGPLFNDRYLWPVVPVVAILATTLSVPTERRPGQVFRLGSRGAAILTGAAFVALALVAVAYAQDSAAYDGARWSAGMEFVTSGAASTDVDAGVEWEGAHSATLRNVYGHGPSVTPEDPFYEGFWPPVDRCFVVSNERLDPRDFAVMGVVYYRSRLWTMRRTLWRLQRLSARGCPPLFQHEP